MKKPFDPQELRARLTMNIRRAERDQNANPLTKLPGNSIINRTILQRLKTQLAILYVDLDNFKAYNDKYGFNLGDDVLKYTAETLIFAVKNHGNARDFIGHIGGDDFIILSTPEKAETIATTICTLFDEKSEQFYNEEDRTRKKINSYDRLGNLQEFPLVSISIAVVSNEKKELSSTAQIAQIAAELKHYAKTKPHGKLGSNYVKDRRS
jgi:diguanylate cyclase (GGDEF)-like protein